LLRNLRGNRLKLIAAGSVMSMTVFVGGLAGLSGSTASASTQPPLTMEGNVGPSLTDNFNPFVSTSANVALDVTSLMYENLLQFDLAKPTTAPYDFLATGYTWGAGGTSITFTIRSGVKFSDGTSFGPADVAFTYNLLKQYPDINLSGLPISGATVSGNAVTITFTSPQYTNLQNIASVPIVPSAIWSTYTGDPAKAVVTNPVATGPYILATNGYTAQGLTLSANPTYWGGPWAVGQPPAVQTIEVPDLTDNTTATNELNANQLQWAGNSIIGVQKIYVSTSSTHHVWDAAENTVSLEPNLTKWPTNQLAVRQAVSLAMNRTALGVQGEGGQEPAATNASGLTLPAFAADLTSASKKATLSGKSNIKAAEAVLTKAGYKKDKAGYFALKGKQVSFTIIDPANYSDYALDGTLIAKSLKSAGIDATFDGTSDNAWYADLADGDFQAAVHWSSGGTVPYVTYDNWLDSTLSSGASAKNASGDLERLNNSTVDSELAKLAGAATPAAQLAALAPLEAFIIKDLPVIPILYGVGFDEYNTGQFTGFPTPANPYEGGQPTSPTDEVVVLHLTAVS